MIKRKPPRGFQILPAAALRSDLFFNFNNGYRAAFLSGDRTFLRFLRNRVLMDVGQAVIRKMKNFRADFNALPAGNAAFSVNLGVHNEASPLLILH
jgi:hypothetical protein